MLINRLLVIGIILIVYSVCATLYAIYFRRAAIILNGVVVRNERNKNEYTPVVRISYQGQEKMMECNESSKFRKYVEGEEIKVYYNPNNHQKVYIVGNNSAIYANILLMGVGVLALILAS